MKQETCKHKPGTISCSCGYKLTAEYDALLAERDMLRKALAGCADALREAGKDFALASPLATRPNLYELHEQAARAALASKG